MVGKPARNVVPAPLHRPHRTEGRDVQTVLENLKKQSYLFDDPRTYQAGVEDALEAVRSLGLLVEEPGREQKPA